MSLRRRHAVPGPAGGLEPPPGRSLPAANHAEAKTRPATLATYATWWIRQAIAVAYITDALAIRQILDHLDLSPPEKPPPETRDLVRVPDAAQPPRRPLPLPSAADSRPCRLTPPRDALSFHPEDDRSERPGPPPASAFGVPV